MEDGEARAVMVAGEPGVGKSRLLDEFADWVGLERERVGYLRGRASPQGRAVTYSLWRDLFAHRFDIRETDTAAEALRKFRGGMAGLLEQEQADLVGHLAGFDFSASPSVAALLGSQSFARAALASFLRFLRAEAEQAPLLLLLEDLHWADDSSLDTLAQVVEGLAGVPLLVLAATRPELWERRPNWGEGQQAYSRLDLKPLSRRASRALVGEILQRLPKVPEAVQQLVVEGAEGNPFYAEELVKMLIEDGAIVPGEEEWRVDLECLAHLHVPPTLTAVLQARLDALPREEKEVLQRASVVGREFWGHLVGELASDVVPPDDVRPLLSALRGRELVYRRERSAFAGTEEYLFKHAVLRDVTYETVLLRLRRSYHAQVAAWLEGHAGERLDEYLGPIAGHYELGNQTGQAISYLLRAGNKAGQQYANPEAIAHFRRALALLDRASPHEFEAVARQEIATRLHEGLGDVLARIGQQVEAQDTYQTALNQVPRDDPIWQARLHRKSGNSWRSMAQYESALEAYDLAEAALGPEADESTLEWWHEWIEIQSQRMELHYWQAQWPEIAKAAEKVRPVVARRGTPRQRADFHASVVMMHFRRDRYLLSDETLAHAQAALAASQESGDPVHIASRQVALGVAHVCRGNLDDAKAELGAALSMAEHIGDAKTRVQCLSWLTIISRKRGRIEETCHYISRSLEAATVAQIPF